MGFEHRHRDGVSSREELIESLARLHRLELAHARELLLRAEQAAAEDPQARSVRQWFALILEGEARGAAGRRTVQAASGTVPARGLVRTSSPRGAEAHAPGRQTLVMYEAEQAAQGAQAPGRQTLVMYEAERAAQEAHEEAAHEPRLGVPASSPAPPAGTPQPGAAPRRDPGHLDIVTQWRMSQAFGFDFSGVSIRRDSPLATGDTRALVKDGEVHFREGAYRPGTRAGDWLIAHELAHVVQQQAGRSDRPASRKAVEREADRAATLAILGRVAPIALRAQPAAAYAFSDGEEHAADLDEDVGGEREEADDAADEREGEQDEVAKPDQPGKPDEAAKPAAASPQPAGDPAPAHEDDPAADLDNADGMDAAGADDEGSAATITEEGGASGGGGGAGPGGGVGAPATKEKAVPSVAAAKPEAGLAQLQGVRPDRIVAALGQIHTATTADVGRTRAEHRANPPKQLSTGDAEASKQAASPGAKGAAAEGEGAAAKGEREGASAKGAGATAGKADQAGKAEVPGGAAAKQAQQGQAAQHQKLAGQVITAVAESIASWFGSWFGGHAGKASGQQQSGMSESETRQMSGSLEKLSTSAGGVSTEPGPAPALAMKGEAKATAGAERAKLEAKTARLEQQGRADSRAPMGESHIESRVPTEELTAKAPPGGAAPDVALPTLEGGAASEEVGIVAKEQHGAEIDAALSKASTDVTAERAKHAQEEQKARADADRQLRDLKTKADADQAAARAKAKGEAEQARGAWQAEIDRKGSDARRQADKQVAAGTAQVEAEEAKANAEAKQHIEEGKQKAEQEKQKGEREAEEAKQKGKRKSSGFFGWLSSKAKAFFNGIKKAISAAIDAARRAVKAVIDAAKKLAMAAIELARKAITAVIQRIGDALIAISEVLLAAFPGLKAKFQAAIRKAVEVATAAVNQIAEGLKQAVQAALDRLGAALDQALGLLEKGLHAIVDVVGAVVQGFLAAAQAIVEALGTWARLIKHIVTGPGAWLGKLGAAVVDGIKNHLWTAFKTAVIEWFKSKVMELLGVGGMLLAILLEGGITTDDIVKMALDALIVAIPAALVAILIEKLVAMIVPAAGALMAIIEGLQAAWGTISRIIAAFGAFMAFLLAVQSGAAGPLFATALASAALVLLDFVANWLLKKLRGPAGKVGARIKGMAAKFKLKGRGKGKGKPGSKPKQKAHEADGPGAGAPKGKPKQKHDDADGPHGPGKSKQKPDKDKKKSERDKEKKDKQDKKDAALVERVARQTAATGWRHAKAESGSRVQSHAEIEAAVRRAARGPTGVRVDVDVVGAGSSWRVKAKATKGSHSATSSTGNGWIAKSKSGQNFYAAKNLASFNRKIIDDAYRELMRGAGKTGKQPKGAAKSLQQQYTAKVSEGERVEKKQQGVLDGKLKGLRFSITMEPFAQVERDRKIKTHFEVIPNATEDDKNIPLDEDLNDAAMEEGKRVAEQHLDETKVCKSLQDPIATRLTTHAGAREDIEQKLTKALGSDDAFKNSINPARKKAVKEAARSGFADFEPRSLDPSSGLAKELRKALEEAVSTGKDATGVEKHIAGLIKRYAGLGIVYDEVANESATADLLRKGIQSEFDKAMSVFFDKHSVMDAGQRTDLKSYAEMAAEDAIKKKLDHMRESVLKKLVAHEEVRQALEKACKDAWRDACKKWVESIVEQAWDPRKALIDMSKMAVYAKHLVATSAADAEKKSSGSGAAQYWPKEGYEDLVRNTLVNGHWGRIEGGTVHAFFDFAPRIVGYDGGNPTSRHRGELTQSDPAQMHGHPKIIWS
jgi:hypothetical protein